MSDTFNVSAAYDKAAYNSGETMTVSVIGNAVQTVVTTEQESIALTLQDAAGETEKISAPNVTVTKESKVTVNVKIASVEDPSGRAWTISADGKSASAVA